MKLQRKLSAPQILLANNDTMLLEKNQEKFINDIGALRKRAHSDDVPTTSHNDDDMFLIPNDADNCDFTKFFFEWNEYVDNETSFLTSTHPPTESSISVVSTTSTSDSLDHYLQKHSLEQGYITAKIKKLQAKDSGFSSPSFFFNLFPPCNNDETFELSKNHENSLFSEDDSLNMALDASVSPADVFSFIDDDNNNDILQHHNNNNSSNQTQQQQQQQPNYFDTHDNTTTIDFVPITANGSLDSMSSTPPISSMDSNNPFNLPDPCDIMTKLVLSSNDTPFSCITQDESLETINLLSLLNTKTNFDLTENTTSSSPTYQTVLSSELSKENPQYYFTEDVVSSEMNNYSDDIITDNNNNNNNNTFEHPIYDTLPSFLLSKLKNSIIKDNNDGVLLSSTSINHTKKPYLPRYDATLSIPDVLFDGSLCNTHTIPLSNKEFFDSLCNLPSEAFMHLARSVARYRRNSRINASRSVIVSINLCPCVNPRSNPVPLLNLKNNNNTLWTHAMLPSDPPLGTIDTLLSVMLLELNADLSVTEFLDNRLPAIVRQQVGDRLDKTFVVQIFGISFLREHLTDKWTIEDLPKCTSNDMERLKLHPLYQHMLSDIARRTCIPPFCNLNLCPIRYSPNRPWPMTSLTPVNARTSPIAQRLNGHINNGTETCVCRQDVLLP